MEINKRNIWLVIPCYNEEEVLHETAARLYEIMGNLIEMKKISPDSKIVMVNDGSSDETWTIINELHHHNSMFCGISLSRNCGHQNALLAGLMSAKNYADAAISLDADLQDDINVIEQFVDQFNEGKDIVYGVRSSRKKDTLFKRISAEGFYKIMRGLGVDLVFNHADYRLMSKRALEELSNYKETNLFLRGIIPQIGFPSATVEYERNARFAGISKYPLKKMLSFAFDGITSFSIKPIRMVLNIGIIVFVTSIVVLLYSLIAKLTGNTVSGWTSIVGSIWFLGGIQLLSLGVVGEYIGKIYSEVKHRPHYIVDQILID
ncbi:MAG: glycosyltransferase family 2 protein, partial [Lachnospiraceae bacterium]